MNIAYFRKSKYSLDKTIQNVEKNAAKQGWKILGVAPLPENIGKMILICQSEWVKKVLQSDYNMVGFLPCAITVFKNDKDILIGTGQPAVIKALTKSKDITEIASKAEEMIKKLIHDSAGVSEPKVKKVRLYSTLSCPYCKMEESWLKQKDIDFETIHVDLNQKAAQEMVAKTGQMGVPVTEIEYDDQDSEYIIGFDKQKLAGILKINP